MEASEVEDLTVRELVGKVRQAKKDALREEPASELALLALASALSDAHSLYVLIARRQPDYTDGRGVSRKDYAGHAVNILITSSAVYQNGTELLRRVRSGEPLRDRRRHRAPVNHRLMTAYSVTTSISLIEAARGRTLAKKRPLSNFGRAWWLIGSATNLAKIGVHLATR